jgi:hypothetical protein
MDNHEKMERAFEFVKDKDDWRKPIDAIVTPLTKAEADVIADAIIYFTGTAPTVTPANDHEIKGFRFEAVGYRMGPCGP